MATTVRNNQVIFGGDLNCLPDDPLNDQLTTIGLDQITPIHEPTFKSRHLYAGHIQRKLDRVFASPSLAATVSIGDYYQSDHKALIVKV